MRLQRYVKASDVTEDSIQGYSINLSYDTTKLEYKSSNSDVSDIGVNGNPIIITKKQVVLQLVQMLL